PLTLVFVFDGRERPSIKRDTHVQGSKPPSWMELAKELIAYMGYHYHQAPGEAEAELSALNRLGLIDAVMTSDSDTLVFGASLIFRTITNSKAEYPGQIKVYNTVRIADDNGISLTRGGFLLIALLCGGDYDPSGLQGCGPAIAYGLARCGFGDQLLEGFHQGLTSEFLDFWRGGLRKELITNSRNFLPSRQPRLASSIPLDFPDPKVIELYVKPVTSCTPPYVLPITQLWRPKEPTIYLLTKFCYENFGWRTEETLKAKFSSLLWDGVFSQMIYSVRNKFYIQN
ncbi:PIN domain-like protein, partial [Pholiota molesta]